jgi:hypothetical protein
MNITHNETPRVKGEITAKIYDQSKLNWLQKKINALLNRYRKRFPELMKFYQLGSLKFVDEHKNVICNAGFNCICKILTGDTGYAGDGKINKMALGTGTGITPAASDTTLDTEDYRNDTASATASSNIAYLTAYFTEAECDGTYTEFGNFIDGEAGADTGSLWSHIAGLNWVKDDTVVLVVSCRYTLASV